MADSTVNAATGSKTATRTTKAGKANKPAAKARAKGKASAARDGTAKEGNAGAKASPSAAKKGRNSGASANKPAARKGAGKRIVLSGLSAEQRRRMIAEQAYYRAERRGFQGGSATEDWLAAEAEVDRMLAKGKPLAV